MISLKPEKITWRVVTRYGIRWIRAEAHYYAIELEHPLPSMLERNHGRNWWSYRRDWVDFLLTVLYPALNEAAQGFGNRLVDAGFMKAEIKAAKDDIDRVAEENRALKARVNTLISLVKRYQASGAFLE